MKGRALIGLSAAILTGLSALPMQALADDATETAINGIWGVYAGVLGIGDAETGLSPWDPGGVRFAPGVHGEPFQAFSKAVPQRFATGTATGTTIGVTITLEDTEFTGDWASAGQRDDRDWVADGADLNMDGRFRTILTRTEDGSWKIYRDIFNVNPSE